MSLENFSSFASCLNEISQSVRKITLNKSNLENNYKIKIDYLELRNVNNLKISSTKKNSRLFIAYYLNNVRLIDNI